MRWDEWSVSVAIGSAINTWVHAGTICPDCTQVNCELVFFHNASLYSLQNSYWSGNINKQLVGKLFAWMNSHSKSGQRLCASMDYAEWLFGPDLPWFHSSIHNDNSFFAKFCYFKFRQFKFHIAIGHWWLENGSISRVSSRLAATGLRMSPFWNFKTTINFR